MPTSEIRDKHGQTIHEGDHVYTPFRGGRHEGDVEKIVTTKQEADEEGVKNPPKVGRKHWRKCVRRSFTDGNC